VIKFLVALALWSLPAAAQIKFHAVEKPTVMQRLGSAPKQNAERQKALFEMFGKVGCQPTEQPIKRSKVANVICVLKGESEDQIIVGGHLDHVEYGDGIIDDWSGASLLPTLYESLKSEPRHHTLIFVGFNKEEVGLVGSASYVKELSPTEKSHVKAMVNLECLGLTKTKVWLSHSDKALLAALAAVAKAMKLEVEGVNVEKVGTADSESFAAAGIPRITLHTVTQDTFPLLHSRNDNLKAIRPDDYYDNYRLAAGYLAALDTLLQPPKEEKRQAGN
jgi:Zn-dependent M28 family amino/carboxypeptidase